MGGHDGGGISDDTKAARGRSEMREILIKRGRTGAVEASSLILQIPSLSVLALPSRPSILLRLHENSTYTPLGTGGSTLFTRVA